MEIAIQLLRGNVDEVVPATLRLGLDPDRVNAVEAVWGPVRTSAAERLLRGGTPVRSLPKHSHWDWTRKSPALQLLAYRGCSVECEGDAQGMMLMLLSGESCRLKPAAGQPLVYIDYVESAPWNIRQFFDPPRFREVGRVLVRAAVQVSIDEGYKGRIGLHSLPQSAGFYRDKIGMTMLGADTRKQMLTYFEMTQDQAMKFIN